MGYTVTLLGSMSPAYGQSRGPRGCWAHARLDLCVLVVLLLVPALIQAQAMCWPEAIATLAAERTRAVVCVELLKRHAGGDAGALSRGELAYAEAKAEIDAVIAGLTVVIAQGDPPPNLADLEARLTRGFEAREAFCQQVTALMPKDPGSRNLLVQLVGAMLPPLLEAVRTLYTGRTEQDRLLRQTIQTQLEAAKWPAFADITP